MLAAGGFADGRGLAAALCLGVSGVWMGTRFLLAQETPLHPDYRQRLEQASISSTVHTDIFDEGWSDAPIRTLRHPTYERWIADGRPISSGKSGIDDVIAHTSDGSDVRRYQSDFPTAGVTGNVLEMVQYAGQSVGLVSSSEHAAAIVEQVTLEAIDVLERRAQSIS